MYNAYDINQQKTDDLRVLKSTAVLTPTINNDAYSASTLFSKVYETTLPEDYLHVLGCVVEYKVNKDYKCYNAGTYWQTGAKRLTADMFSVIINNFYLRPSYKNPYYYINNVNVSNTFPTTDSQEDVLPNKYVITVTAAEVTTSTKISIVTLDGTVTTVVAAANDTGTLLAGKITSAIPSISSSVTSTTTSISIVDSAISDLMLSGPGLSVTKTPSSTRIAKDRYGNKSKVRLEIRYGKDNTVFELTNVLIDYLKVPQFIRLTEEQVYEVEDHSQILEFPDYVCQEIVNELIKLLMENASDQRLQTHIPVNQSIAMPGQEQPTKGR